MISADKKLNIRGLIRQLKKKNYKVFERPYELNIVGIRANTTKADKFDDLIYVFWKDSKKKWQGKAYPATTDPGTYWLKNPMHPKGSAILKEGQYIDTWIKRLHPSTNKGYGQYMALGEEKPVTVYRDYDRNAILDFYNGNEHTGNFGINIHRASVNGDNKTIKRNSAGCQVFQNANDFAEFMKMVDKQKDLYGNKFTYTLIDERAYQRSLRRYGAYFLVSAMVIAGYVGFRTYRNKSIIPKLTTK
jgi:hypothetical protein